MLTKRGVGTFAGCFALLSALFVFAWLKHEDHRFSQRREHIKECLSIKTANQVCYMGDDGSVTIREKPNKEHHRVN